ncbi:hypothetical protein [Deinococcus marmoris]|nr:hypothetical protein [Deinococcus marmoris]
MLREVWAIIEADAELSERTPQQHAADILTQYADAPLSNRSG